jgi:hypothetical protein
MAYNIVGPRPWFVAKLTRFLGEGLASTAISSVAAWTGTATRTTKAAYTAPDISAAYVEAEVQGIATATADVSQAFKALTDDLRTRGIIS